MKPICVAISDVHAGLKTEELAERSLIMAIDEAARLGVPLFIVGDLNDTKAIIRGEIAIMLIRVFTYAKKRSVSVLVLVGNHDKINEKGQAHSLEFLRPYATIIDAPGQVNLPGRTVYAVPYQSEKSVFMDMMRKIIPGALVFVHQGVTGAHMGEYVADKSQVDPAFLEPWKCISGHYHRHQTVGSLTYIGTPYTVSFSEAKDGPKGFQVVYEDGSMKQIKTNLRKHVIEEVDLEGLEIYIHTAAHPNPEDIFWLKVSGPYSELAKLDKKAIGKAILGHSNFRLDPIPTDDALDLGSKLDELTNDQILDKLIDDSEETAKQKKYLKALWREAMQ